MFEKKKKLFFIKQNMLFFQENTRKGVPIYLNVGGGHSVARVACLAIFDTVDIVGMSCQGLQLLAPHQVPHFHSTI